MEKNFFAGKSELVLSAEAVRQAAQIVSRRHSAVRLGSGRRRIRCVGSMGGRVTATARRIIWHVGRMVTCRQKGRIARKLQEYLVPLFGRRLPQKILDVSRQAAATGRHADTACVVPADVSAPLRRATTG